MVSHCLSSRKFPPSGRPAAAGSARAGPHQAAAHTHSTDTWSICGDTGAVSHGGRGRGPGGSAHPSGVPSGPTRPPRADPWPGRGSRAAGMIAAAARHLVSSARAPLRRRRPCALLLELPAPSPRASGRPLRSTTARSPHRLRLRKAAAVPTRAARAPPPPAGLPAPGAPPAPTSRAALPPAQPCARVQPSPQRPPLPRRRPAQPSGPQPHPHPHPQRSPPPAPFPCARARLHTFLSRPAAAPPKAAAPRPRSSASWPRRSEALLPSARRSQPLGSRMELSAERVLGRLRPAVPERTVRRGRRDLEKLYASPGSAAPRWRPVSLRDRAPPPAGPSGESGRRVSGPER